MIFLVLVHFCEPPLSIPFDITDVHLQQSSLQAKEVLTCFPGVCVLFEYLRRQICTLSSAKLERSGLISSCYLQARVTGEHQKHIISNLGPVTFERYSGQQHWVMALALCTPGEM